MYFGTTAGEVWASTNSGDSWRCIVRHLPEMLAKFIDILDSLIVYPENMRRNLEKMGGLVCSEQVMLALIASGLSREEAYTTVQRNAAKAWAGESFQHAIANDPAVKDRLSPDQLAHCFDIQYHLKNLAYTFEKLGI